MPGDTGRLLPKKEIIAKYNIKDNVNVLTDGIYNDLGFLSGDRFVILLEAQSLWTENIIVRALLYLAQTYHDYFERTNQYIFSAKSWRSYMFSWTNSVKLFIIYIVSFTIHERDCYL